MSVIDAPGEISLALQRANGGQRKYPKSNPIREKKRHWVTPRRSVLVRRREADLPAVAEYGPAAQIDFTDGA
jgi:hypothetical protein